ncbi:hypothetical protein TGRH88_007600 [Toxoplasma gondii]|uniref:Uncharacterized protein n=1 Tax=Toxoplasma gondii TaxID=5811 RepID=A0A7J6KBW7_TOXGO|nr:hypothetical protein TGRH88_007600 [Toxoplasma gondii]
MKSAGTPEDPEMASCCLEAQRSRATERMSRTSSRREGPKGRRALFSSEVDHKRFYLFKERKLQPMKSVHTS